MRFVRASFKEGNQEGGMCFMQTCSNDTTSLTAADDDVVEVLFRGHDEEQERVIVCQGMKMSRQVILCRRCLVGPRVRL